ncbi:MAG: 2-C-methyl-D-erythritol 4-phosphate cytidylyltransferase [Bacteroidales bacterium]|nr:2-C-methyl-D-erythritol 4-phosphate cytidylyltransferase [Bacteroidales bacterium]
MKNKERRYAIIVAGGKGLRMGAAIPKQFLLLSGRPLLMHTIEAFYLSDPEISLILVLPESQQAYWKDLCSKYDFKLPCQIVNGGDTRYESVKNGLALTGDKGLVAVHDGVRPFISPDLIERCYAAAAEFGAVVPVTQLTESIRRLDGETSFSVRREIFRSVQTPQVFRVDLLKKAYLSSYSELFTDDASVVEAAGFKVELVEGNPENIKITTTIDLLMAEQIKKLNPGQ